MQVSKQKKNSYSMPFEGNPHKGTIVLLPYRADTWRENAKPGRECFLNLVKIISKYEMVYLVADPSIDDSLLEPFKLENVEIIRLPYNDSWARDNTLIYVQDGGKNKAIDFRFNAWGGEIDGLYDNWEDDDKLGKALASYFNDEIESKESFILEGGSIHTDGERTLITTEACLLSEGRNKDLTKEEIEEELKESLGMDKVLWLPHGIYNDETNEHVDNMACFLAPGVIAIATTNDKTDIQYQWSMEAINYLKGETDAKGRSFKIIEIPVPKTLALSQEEADGLELGNAIKRPEGNRLAGSYINFYMSDKFVIVPKFNVVEDEYAKEVLKDFYPNKDIYQLESRELLLAGGNIHCVTMQIPKEK